MIEVSAFARNAPGCVRIGTWIKTPARDLSQNRFEPAARRARRGAHQGRPGRRLHASGRRPGGAAGRRHRDPAPGRLSLICASRRRVLGRRAASRWRKFCATFACKEGGTQSRQGRRDARGVSESWGVLGESGTLGGCFPSRPVRGCRSRSRAKTTLVLCFFGDGTSNRGTFHDELNFCAVRKLRVVFLCENNGWAVSMPTRALHRGERYRLARRRATTFRASSSTGNDPEGGV